MKQLKQYIFLFLCLSTLVACQPTKYLQEDELLYKGSSLNLSKPLEDQPNKNFRAILSTKVKQQPNKKFKLWIYQKFRNKEKGLGNWLKKKIGQAPVIYNPQSTEQSRLIMESTLRDNGFLNAVVTTDTTIKQKKVAVKFNIKGNGQFKINEYHLPPDSTLLLGLINQKQRKPIIKSGQPFTMTTIDAERLRLEHLARNNGFYEFEKDVLFFYIDTTAATPRMLDIHLILNHPANEKTYRPHKLGSVTIYPDYELNGSAKQDTIRSDSWTIIQDRHIVGLKALQEAIAQDSGAIYNLSLERQAVNYLLDFGIFKFVNLQYVKDSIDGELVLHRNFYLTPSLNQDFGIDLETSTERTNFLGYSAGVNYTHRNIFRNAESFQTGLSLGVETQAGGGGPFINTLEFSYNAGLSIPRLLLPFKITKRIKGAIPKTLINVNASYQKRNTLFTSASLLTELGYSWKQSNRFRHQFYPFQMTMLRLLKTSNEFEMELNENPRLRASFDDLFILAANYRFSFSNQLLNGRKNYFFFRGEVETAGNVASMIFSPSEDSKLNVAQFARVVGEMRYTFYQRKTSIVARFSAGYAKPYGNSEAVPYIRQFFVGGASSNRGFRFRGVGPGTYSPEPSDGNTNFAFFDRVGDIKIESNIEYRFPISGYFKGALFVDAGNVWLGKSSSENLPEGAFNFSSFYRELAIGSGIGLRVDVDYVVIRFDFGIPLRDPSLEDGSRWLFNDIRLGSKTWRKEKLKFNLAIGYPF